MVQWLVCELGTWETQVQFPTLPQMSCVMLGNSLSLSVLQFRMVYSNALPPGGVASINTVKIERYSGLTVVGPDEYLR